MTVTDLKTKKELASSLKTLKGLPIRYVLGQHRMNDFTSADLVVYNPGVRARFMKLEDSPYLSAAMRAGVKLDTDIGLFFEILKEMNAMRRVVTIIGVTGSKGKSTTAALIAHILKTRYPRTELAGNIRASVFDILPHITPPTLPVYKGRREGGTVPIVLELSSWQLEGLARHRQSPNIAVITNILREHVNAYSGFHAYREAKKHILRFQHRGDIAILNENIKPFPEFRQRCGMGRIKWFTWRKLERRYTSAWKLPGRHNRMNLAAALTVAQLFKIPSQDMVRAVRSFKGLEGRLETVRRIRGVTFINDTAATMPDAVVEALRTFSDPRSIILIFGGVDKASDYQPLANFLSAYPVKALVLLPGNAGDALCAALSATESQISRAIHMRQAVRSAWRLAEKGDTILLSPGAASFNLFQNEFDRGDYFVKAIASLR